MKTAASRSMHILLLGYLLITTGCSTFDENAAFRQQGKVFNGKLELMEVGHEANNGLLEHEYGMMIWDQKYLDEPRRFELFFQKKKIVFRTEDLDAFKTELARIPRGEKLYEYDTCTVSSQNNLPEEVMQEIEVRCEELGIKIVGRGHGDDDGFANMIICTCDGA